MFIWYTLCVPRAFACGFASILLGALVAGAALMFTEENFLEVTLLIVSAHLPVMVIEGVMTIFCVTFFRKVKPDLLPGAPGRNDTGAKEDEAS